MARLGTRGRRATLRVRLQALGIEVAFSVAGILVVIALWYAASAGAGRFLPPPHTVFANGWEHLFSSRYLQGLGLPAGGYLPHLGYTVRNVIVGVAIGASIGILIGLMSWRWKILEEIVDPIVTIFGTLPILVAAPFFLIWFGLVAFAQIVLVAFYTAVVLQLYTLRAARHVHPKYFDYARTLGAGDRVLFVKVVVPAAFPEIVGGLRIALASAWGLAAIAELLGAQFGVGRVIVSLTAVYDVESIMALVLLLSLIAIAIDAAVGGVKRIVTGWMPRDWKG